MKAASVLLVLFALFLIYNAATQKETKTVSPYIDLTETMRNDLTTKIKEAGFNCPRVYSAKYEAETAYGTKTKIVCTNNIAFNVTIAPNDRVLVKPWN